MRGRRRRGSRNKYRAAPGWLLFVINCKNYAEACTADGLERLARIAGDAGARHGIDVAVAPPQHMVGLLAARGAVPVLAQHVDDTDAGGTTGFVSADLLKRAGAAGSLVNHSEHRVDQGAIEGAVGRLRSLGMISVLCARDVGEARRFAGLDPDYVAVEPPELIGSGRAVSVERPELVSEAAAAVRDAGGRTRLLCGAGIVSGRDVAKAAELGSAGILVASGIIRADSWERAICEFAGAMAGAAQD